MTDPGSTRATPDPGFTFRSYLVDHAFALCIGTLGLLCATGMLGLLGISIDGIITVMGFIVTCLGAILVWGYLRRVRYWKEARAIIGTLDKSGSFPEMIEQPPFLDGRLAEHAIEELLSKSEQEMAAAVSDLKASREYIELWVHEVKTPIAAAKLILNGMHGEQANKLKTEIERMETLVEQALYAARATSLVNDYAIREVSLLELAQEACKGNMHLLVAKGVTVSMDIPAELTVLADRSWMIFVLSQLISNAAKYDATELRFSGRAIDETGSHGHCVLEVEDDGCGIPARDVPRVFDRAFTGSIGRAHGSATGMGLYLVATMCAKMGLGVQLASEEGEGTRVIILFPQDRRRLARWGRS